MTDVLNLIVDNKLIALLISISGAFYWVLHRMRTELNEKKKEFMEKVLVNNESVQSFKHEIEENLSHNPNLYKEELRRTLGFLDKHLEPLKLFSSKAFDKHLNFSLIYSFLFFYLVWLFGGVGTIGSHEFMPNENRLSITFYLIFEIVAIYFFLTRQKEILNFIVKKIPYFSRLSNTWQELLGVGVGVLLSKINFNNF